MPLLTNSQLQGLASSRLGSGTPLFHGWDRHPGAPSWGWALLGGPGGFRDDTPPSIFEHALLVDNDGHATGINPHFRKWVAACFPDNCEAQVQAATIDLNFNAALHDEGLQLLVRTAFARLCVAVSPLTASEVPTNYLVVMASDHWYTGDHWALGLRNNIDAPYHQTMQYTQRDAGVNAVHTRCKHVWGGHPLLMGIYVQELLDGHIESLRHAIGWPNI